VVEGAFDEVLFVSYSSGCHTGVVFDLFGDWFALVE